MNHALVKLARSSALTWVTNLPRWRAQRSRRRPGNSNDSHTLKTVIPDMEALTGNIIDRLVLDKGYRGHNAPSDYKFRVFISGQKRRVS